MYIRKTNKSHKGKIYTNYLLVESVSTPKGPRQRIICSLGSLAPAPSPQWLDLAHRLAASLQGQTSLPAAAPPVQALAEKVRRARGSPHEASAGPCGGLPAVGGRYRAGQRGRGPRGGLGACW